MTDLQIIQKDLKTVKSMLTKLITKSSDETITEKDAIVKYGKSKKWFAEKRKQGLKYRCLNKGTKHGERDFNYKVSDIEKLFQS